MVGQRHAHLLRLANLGVMAGLRDDQIESEIRSNGGTPLLSEAEVRSAVRKSRGSTQPLTLRPGTTWAGRPAQRQPNPLGLGATTYVHQMISIGEGSTFETLASASPIMIPDVPVNQAALFLETMFAPHEFVFCGWMSPVRGMEGSVSPASDRVQYFLRDRIDVTPLFTCNPLTGKEGLTKDGKPSRRCAACVASYRYCLIEFDAPPLSLQCAFWGGVIASRTLPLRSLVYSGGKSIHGLVEVGCQDAASWMQTTNTLFFAVANPLAKKEHQADRACRTPERLTRLPGAERPDTGKVQSLLWLAPRVAAAGAPTTAPTGGSTPTRTDHPDAPAHALGTSGTVKSTCCRDCWNWQPNGVLHGCTAGVTIRPSPDFAGVCNSFKSVLF